MAITETLVLSPGALLIPVSELPEEVRQRFEHREADFALTHPRLRAPSSILDTRSAELVELFRTPRTVVDAVICFSRSREADPETTLEEAYPLLERLVAAGFLVPEDSDDAAGILPSLLAGEMIAGFEVVECVQELEDTDVYQVRGAGGPAALKIERRPSERTRLGWEAAVLEHLGGAASPRYLTSGEIEGRRYLLMEWCPGVQVDVAAWELRRRGIAGRPALLSLCREVCAAYARLHERGVLHGDVHLRNVLVDAGGGVRLVDFGLARWDAAPADLPRPWRAGVPFFFEPEYAVAARAGAPLPEPTAAGEQYAVAALLYFLLTGAHYRDFLLDREPMLRQIAEEPPLPFAERAAEPWPEVEEILVRALAKSPENRFSSMAELVEAFESAGHVPAPAARERPAAATAAEVLLSEVLVRLEPEGDLFRQGLAEPPYVSVSYGAAGIACALYRMALAREDADLLIQADLWAARAMAHGDAEDGFYDPHKGLTQERVGQVTPYHTASGPAAVQALVAHAAGLPNVQRAALEAFVRAARRPCENPDLTLGRAGVLLAASLLYDTCDELLGESIAQLGDELLEGLWRELDAQPAIPELAPETSLGVAHGWTGYLYASLRWCRSRSRAAPERLRQRLSELADCARLWGRGLRWRWHAGETLRGFASMPGWCNGSAGYVYLFSLAHRMLGDSAYRALAEGAAWNAWEAAGDGASLCCGLAGRAYALLHLHRHGGGPEWLERARHLAERAALEASRRPYLPNSLYKGEVGVAVLAADLARPEEAAMPFFEEEGWN